MMAGLKAGNQPMSALLLRIYRHLYDRYGPQGWWPGDGHFETMVGAILTQNTAWTNVEKALANLKGAGALSPEAIRSIPEPDLALLIRPSGYFNAKVRKLKAMAVYLARYDDAPERWRNRDPKELRAELLEVHGIGPETADAIVLYVAGLPSFVIDAYTERVVTRLGLAALIHGYEQFQALFEENLPADAELFNEYHALLDRHAVVTCLKARPLCQGCCLLDLCPMGQAAFNSEQRS
jgi:endonuclease-3 related protein